jgi:hypothetical protein
MKKLGSIAVKTGTYTDKTGKEKGRYENVGVILEMDDGKEAIFLKRTFNPAGVPAADGRDQIPIYRFYDTDDQQQSPSQHQQQKSNGYAPKDGLESDIPF